jgi:N-acetylglucosamine repressor
MPNTIRKPRVSADLESAIVRTVHARGTISRIDVARALGVVPSTSGIYVDRLIERGYLLESAATSRGLGRPPVLLDLNPKGGRFIGVDFDARQVMTASVDFAQRPLVQICRTIPARATAERVLSMIEASIAEVIGKQPRNVLGIGLGVPGPIDAKRGVSLEYKFIRGWQNVPIGDRIGAAFRAPVFVENNLRSMALGELWAGEGRGLRELLCLGIRSGIGLGIIADGKLLRGAHNSAGEIGRWVVPDGLLRDQPTSLQAKKRAAPTSIEDVASVTALLDEAASRLAAGESSSLGSAGDQPSVAELLGAASAGDSLARSIVTRAAGVHGWIIHQLAALLDPERIILAGPLVDCEEYQNALNASAERLGGAELRARIVRSTLGRFAGARGAASLAFHHWKARP